MRTSAALLLAAALSSCADLPADAPGATPSTGISQLPFQPLDPGAYEQSSLHFMVKAYGADNAHQISDQAESYYKGIMTDTNLFSFMPAGLYEIVVYADHDEYARKTGQPGWSGGITYGNAICSYAGPELKQTIAHEMTHLIFNEFMGRARRDLLWLNEGLAVYEQEKAASGTSAPVDLFIRVHGPMRSQPMAPADFLAFVPLSEKTDDSLRVTLWYAQAESMAQYVIDRGGRLGFSQLLESLKDGQGFDQAFAAAYPGVWTDFGSFVRGWQASPQ